LEAVASKILNTSSFFSFANAAYFMKVAKSLHIAYTGMLRFKRSQQILPRLWMHGQIVRNISSLDACFVYFYDKIMISVEEKYKKYNHIVVRNKEKTLGMGFAFCKEGQQCERCRGHTVFPNGEWENLEIKIVSCPSKNFVFKALHLAKYKKDPKPNVISVICDDMVVDNFSSSSSKFLDNITTNYVYQDSIDENKNLEDDNVELLKIFSEEEKHTAETNPLKMNEHKVEKLETIVEYKNDDFFADPNDHVDLNFTFPSVNEQDIEMDKEKISVMREIWNTLENDLFKKLGGEAYNGLKNLYALISDHKYFIAFEAVMGITLGAFLLFFAKQNFFPKLFGSSEMESDSSDDEDEPVHKEGKKKKGKRVGEKKPRSREAAQKADDEEMLNMAQDMASRDDAPEFMFGTQKFMDEWKKAHPSSIHGNEETEVGHFINSIRSTFESVQSEEEKQQRKKNT